MAIDDNPREDIYYPNDEFRKEAHISSLDEYRKLYEKSIEDPETFCMDIAIEFYWKRSPSKPLVSYNFDVSKGPIRVKWLDGALTNMCYNVLDRVVDKGLGDRVAYYWFVEFIVIFKICLKFANYSGNQMMTIRTE